MNLPQLAPGSYTLEITRPDSRPWKGELTVLPGEHALVQISLEPDTHSDGAKPASPQ